MIGSEFNGLAYSIAHSSYSTIDRSKKSLYATTEVIDLVCLRCRGGPPTMDHGPSSGFPHIEYPNNEGPSVINEMNCTL